MLISEREELTSRDEADGPTAAAETFAPVTTPSRGLRERHEHRAEQHDEEITEGEVEDSPAGSDLACGVPAGAHGGKPKLAAWRRREGD